MITVITGSPGSGKTLYAIQELIKPIIGTTITTVDDDGVVEVLPRTIYTNINGFQMEHELIDGREDGGLKNWHEWAKPGALIVYDEFQKTWPPRPNGSKVPDDVQALDTHRHMGVDFILITQNLNNVDRHVVGLVGRHLHVRRVGNLPLCTVYEWDQASRSLLYSKAFSKKGFRYKRSTYKLYKSAKAHTKMPRSIPSMVWILVGALALAAYAMPNAYSRLTARLSDGLEGKTALSSSSKVTSSTTTITQGPPPGMVLPGREKPAESAAVPALALTPAAPVLAGCVAVPGRCSCVTDKGQPIELDEKLCADLQAAPRPFGDLGILRTEHKGYRPPPEPTGLHF